MKRGPVPIPLEIRFWQKVAQSDGCWNWLGAKNARGYGKIKIGIDRITVEVHRVSWQLHFGEIPAEMHVCHHCDNPLCVRPDHLFLGTPRDNVHDCIRKGRHSFGEQRHNSKLQAADVIAIRQSKEPLRALAKKYGVHTTTIHDAKRGKNWKHL